MTGQELDELEALLVERAENLNDPEAYHRDIAEVMLKAADAIAELRVRNAGLEVMLRHIRDYEFEEETPDWLCIQMQKTFAATALKENTQ